MQPDVLSRLLADKQKLGAGAVGLLALVCVAYLGSGLYQDIAVARTQPALAINDRDQPAASSGATAISIDTLVAAHFFGASSVSQSPQQVPQERVPETRMSLQLHGVIGSTVAEEGRALIAQKGQRAKYYGVNDTLPGGASVHSIAANQVVLSRNGMLETLSFPKPQSHPDSPSFAAAENETGTPETEDTTSQFQQLHESQVADNQPPYSESQPEEPAPASMSIKERLKQLRESRDL